MGLQYGIKEVCDVSILDFKTKEVLDFIDYASASSTENSAERLDITGGRGNAKLLSFDHSRTAMLSLTLPLVSLETLAILTGQDIASGTDVGSIFKREVVKAQTGTTGIKIALSKNPIGDVKAYKLEGLRDHGDAQTVDLATLTTATVGGATVYEVEFTTPTVVAGDEVVVYYQYDAPTTAKKISVKSTKFPKAVEIFAEGLARNQEDEQDYPCHIHVFKARPQANFTFTMEGTNATNLEIMFDMYEIKNEKGEGQYIDYIFETA